MVQGMVQKVVRKMSEIRALWDFGRSFVRADRFEDSDCLSCEEGRFVGFDLLRRVFCGWAGKIVRW